LAQTWYYGGPIASGAIDTGLDNGKIIAAAGKQEICDRWKKLAPSGCEVGWNETEKRCELTKGDCVYVGNDILSKEEYDVRQKELERAASEDNEDTEDASRQKRHKDCEDAGGVFKSDGKCYCDGVVFEPDVYKCQDKKLVK
jgi:hypothetical protein